MIPKKRSSFAAGTVVYITQKQVPLLFFFPKFSELLQITFKV